MKFAKRYQELTPYFFAKLSDDKAKARALGRDLIDLSIGDPDLDPPKSLINRLKVELDKPGVHGYPAYIATEKFRTEAAGWLSRRHDVRVDPHTELTGVIGSKEGLAHFLMAIIDEGDYAVIPTPYYPMYTNAVKLAGGTPYLAELKMEDDFLLDLDSVPEDVWNKTKVLILCYPHNPTSATADRSFWERAVEKANKYGFIICSDAAYLDIYDDEAPTSLLSIPGAKEVGVEFHSLSKTFSIPGWRLGYVAGNSELIAAARKMKQSIDSGQFTALDMAASHLLETGDAEVDGIRSIYAGRRKFFKPKLEGLGFKVFSKPSTLYLWAKIPNSMKSVEYARMLLEKTDVVVTPGMVFGDAGEEYIRFSMTSPTKRLEEAAKRLARL